MTKNIFVTGGTGFLGSNLVKTALEDADNKVILLARDKAGNSAEKRVSEVIKTFYKKEDEYTRNKSRIEVVKGDITQPYLGIENRDRREELIKKIDIIFHSAALTKFNAPLSQSRMINVEGTENLLKFALDCKKHGRLKNVAHISTSFSAMKIRGCVFENFYKKSKKLTVLRFLKKSPVFGKILNTQFLFTQLDYFNYPQSKLEAELLVKKYQKKGLIVSIFRPSAIIGNSRTGEASDFNAMYLLLQVLNNMTPEEVPFNKDTPINLVPVDSVSKAIYLMGLNDSNSRIYNIVHPKSISLGFWMEQASKYFGFVNPKAIPLGKFDMGKLTNSEKKIFYPFIMVANSNISYDIRNAKSFLDRYSFEWPNIDKELLECMFKYCEKVNLLIRSN
ncbi:MAG: NAD-dependent epimerase/dehydratase family protein [PVC group bacterium]|nr:NAD-dependent epimerase/dehydratase family protein [PVC group bacterium]